MRRLLHIALCMAAIAVGFAVPSSAPAESRGVGLIRRPVEFMVQNPAEGGTARRIVGYRYDTFCASPTAVLLMHGLSYTKEAWDFPGYSVAQKIAEAGYAAFAIDRLGYGESKLDNGYNVTHEAVRRHGLTRSSSSCGPAGLRPRRPGGTRPGRARPSSRPPSTAALTPSWRSGSAPPAVEPAGPGLLHRRLPPGGPGRLRVLPRHTPAPGRDVLQRQRRPGGGGGRHQGRRPSPRAPRSSPSASSRPGWSWGASRCRSSSSSATATGSSSWSTPRCTPASSSTRRRSPSTWCRMPGTPSC